MKEGGTVYDTGGSRIREVFAVVNTRVFRPWWPERNPWLSARGWHATNHG